MSIRTGKQTYRIHHRVGYYIAIKMNGVYLYVDKKKWSL